MRFVRAFLLVALTGSVALADEGGSSPNSPEAQPVAAPAASTARAPRVPLRIVRMLTETRQVLLLDKNRGTHVVAEVGQEVDGYIVDEIGEDEVTLVAPSGAEVILAAPESTWRRPPAPAAARPFGHAGGVWTEASPVGGAGPAARDACRRPAPAPPRGWCAAAPRLGPAGRGPPARGGAGSSPSATAVRRCRSARGWRRRVWPRVPRVRR